MSKENKAKCKYCHLGGHVIDKCPTIICKHCKAIGHPNWLCKSNPNAENNNNNDENITKSPNLRNKKSSIYAFESTNSLKGNQSNKQNNQSNNNLYQPSCDSKSPEGCNTSRQQMDINENVEKKNDKNDKNVYVGFKDDFKQKVIQQVEIIEEKVVVKEKEIINLRYYQKKSEQKWGDLIELF